MTPGEVPAGIWQEAVDVWNKTHDMACVLAAVIPRIQAAERDRCEKVAERELAAVRVILSHLPIAIRSQGAP